jgi:hypothetical protein
VQFTTTKKLPYIYDKQVFSAFKVNSIQAHVVHTFRQETPQGSRLDCAYFIKVLDSEYVIAHQRVAPTANTDMVDLVHLLGFEPATLGSVAHRHCI